MKIWDFLGKSGRVLLDSSCLFREKSMVENIQSHTLRFYSPLSRCFFLKWRRNWSQILRKWSDHSNLEESEPNLDAHTKLWRKAKEASFFIHFIIRKYVNRSPFLILYCLPTEFNFCPIEKTHILLPVISVAIQLPVESNFLLPVEHTFMVVVSCNILWPTLISVVWLGKA